tara:strand:+ start:1657 stop:2613 length:957 start_codon:yes stop_codon:yes gene_type:complete
MGKQDPYVTNLKTLVIGCTPLARKVTNLLKQISNLVGVVNLHPEKGLSKSNYDPLTDICEPFWTKDINDKETEEWIRSRDPEVIIQCGWSQIFKPHVLELASKYCIGIHPSPLPEGRGAAIINWKIIESEGKSINWGNSLFVMQPKTDTGAVLDFEPFDIQSRDTVRTAYQKVDKTALTMIKRTISKIADNKEELIEQDKTKVTRYYKRKPEDGKIELSWPAVKVNDYVRALTHPYPGAFIESNFGQLFLWDVSIDSCKIHGNPGLVYQIHDGRGMLVKVGGFMCVWLKRVSHNGIEQWADEWARDMGIREGDNLIER